MKATPTVFNIPAGVAFVDALVAGIRARHGDDPIALSGVTVLLPTRRACRALRDAFLRLSNGKPTLLPVMRPLGDIEEDELALAVGEQSWEGDDPAATFALPPALSPIRRRLLLAQLIQRREADVPADQALFLAGELARLLDQMQIEEVPFTALSGIVPADLAHHWQEVLTFLHIISDQWPRLLAAEGAMDPAERRSKLLDAQAALWSAQPPQGAIIAAGSTGTVPATARLLRVVGRLAQGSVVLPGLDVAMPEASWTDVDAAHPQHAMKNLLGVLGVARAGVEPWLSPAVAAPAAARVALLAEALKPAAAWAEPSAGRIDADAARDLYRLDCANPEEEARAIALALREALETEGRTAALVTPDRSLARRVTAELERWNVAVDDSAGTPLALTPVGTFLRLTATMIAEDLAPIPLLAALKHPLAAGGSPPQSFRWLVRRLDHQVLRGPRPVAGFAGLRAALDPIRNEKPRVALALGPWLDDLERRAGPFAAVVATGSASLADLMRAHVGFAESLAANSHEEDAGLRLWGNDDGEAAAVWVEEVLRVAAQGSPPFACRHYPRVLAELMAGVTVRPRFAKHPRLHIWGPLEARMQQADVLVLGGLNEGTWPPEITSDAWMSRPMRQQAGLPPLERRVGLAAHDFAQAAAAPTVLLTHATKVDGAPTVPSRWLDRLAAVLSGNRLSLAAPPWLAWQRGFAHVEVPAPLSAPVPRPPVEKRPRKLSATTIETWVRDPYAVYARYVLRLRALDPIDADPDARDRGQIIHRAIDTFLRSQPDVTATDALPRMIECGRIAFEDLFAKPGVWAFWWPRFQRIADWFVANERTRLGVARLAASEVHGESDVAGPAGPFRVTATADRIDRLMAGGLAIIDYKTGSPPKSADILAGFAPQLAIEGMLAMRGAFPGIAADRVNELAIWTLSGLGNIGSEMLAAKTPEGVQALIADLNDGLAAYIAAFDNPAMPYRSRPRPDFGPRHSYYDHLARVREWSAGPGEDEMIHVVPR